MGNKRSSTKHNRWIILIAALTLVAVACSCPLTKSFQVAPPPQETPAPADAQPEEAPQVQEELPATPSETPTETPEASPTACSPSVTATMNVNVRQGPDTAFSQVGALSTGQSASALAKSVNGAFWQIQFVGGVDGKAWVWDGGVTGDCIPANFPLLAGPSTPTPPPTVTPTPTPTFFLVFPIITVFPIAGDLRLDNMFLATTDEVIFTISNNPTGHYSGSLQYQVHADGSLVQTGTCTIPAGSMACWTGYTVSGTRTIRGVIDSNNAFVELNETNNEMTRQCSSSGNTCN